MITLIILIFIMTMTLFVMMTFSTGGVLPAPDGPPVRHVSHYGDAPSPAVCQVKKITMITIMMIM